jgi:hypothetical protein
MNLCKRLLCSAVLAALFGFGCGSAWAQDALTGSISGTVMDPTGAIIVGATVTLTNTDRGQDIRVLKTSAEGFYTATIAAAWNLHGEGGEPGIQNGDCNRARIACRRRPDREQDTGHGKRKRSRSRLPRLRRSSI